MNSSPTASVVAVSRTNHHHPFVAFGVLLFCFFLTSIPRRKLNYRKQKKNNIMPPIWYMILFLSLSDIQFWSKVLGRFSSLLRWSSSKLTQSFSAILRWSLSGFSRICERRPKLTFILAVVASPMSQTSFNRPVQSWIQKGDQSLGTTPLNTRWPDGWNFHQGNLD